MEAFSKEFITGARRFVEEGRGLIYRPIQPVTVSDDELLPTFFSRLAGRYGVVVVDPHGAIRKDQEQVIADDLLSGNGVLLRGFWRTGKSSMVRALEERFSDSIKIDFYADAKKASYFKNHPYTFAADEVSDYLSRQSGRILADVIKTGQLSPLDALEKYLDSNDKKILISVEEPLELWTPDLEVIANLRGRERLMVLVSAQIHPDHNERVVSAFQGFSMHYLRPLYVQEAGLLIRSPLEDTPVSVTDEAIDDIYEYCGGWPTAIKSFFRTLIDNYSSVSRFREVYCEIDVKDVVSKSPRELFSTPFGQSLGHFARIYHEGLEEIQQRVLDKIAKVGELDTSEIDSREIDILLKTGLILETTDCRSYRLNGAFLRDLIYSGFIHNLRR